MKEIIQGFYQKKHFWTRLILVIAAVILMGFALSWLLLVDLGTDPCTLLNQTISTRLGISIGNWQALFNTVLLIFVIIFGGRNLGFGTLANMFLVGYSIDFFSWIWAKVLPADLFTSMGVRIAVLIPALILSIAMTAYVTFNVYNRSREMLSGNVERTQGAPATDFFAFDGLNNQIASKVHVQRR